MHDLISVIIPVYKVEKYLCRCVDSVLEQTYTNMEIILVDDGSPDNCPVMCDEYARQDSRVKVIHQENAGLSGARNAGIDMAQGQWLAFVDSDDYLAADFLERLYQACVDTGSSLSVCRWEYVRGETIPEHGTGETRVYTGREMLANLYVPDGAYFVVAWNKLYRKELFEDIRYPLGRIHEDEATTYRIYDKVKKAAYVDRSLYGYFVTPVSITRGFNPKRMDWVTAVAERLDFFEQKGYTELMVPGLQALADGSIDIWFGLRDQLPGSEKQQEEIRTLIREGLRRVKKYGKFPLRTEIGYRMFLTWPGLYRKLLNQVKDENGKQ
ncbi:glycosyltransferase family 2 protein [Laedolimicola sp.]|uniref:glycosyltransferase family 2 protein n=1 Tax=Laedolimicola sp. TaxID=2981663 RepID=UPI003F7CDC10